MSVVEPVQRGSQMLLLPHVDIRRRQMIAVAPGTNVAQMVDAAFPGLGSGRERLRVTIGDQVIAPDLWHRVRPRDGATVVIRVVPGSDTLRSVLTVAVLVAAVSLGQFYAPALAGTVAGAAGATSLGGAALVSASTVALYQAGITAAVAIAGNLLINALVPIRGLGNQEKGSDVYAITGLRNSANPNGVIPSVLGTHRYAPVYAATPYTQVIGDDQYVVAAFLFGHGPLSLSNHRLGETPIDSFSDVEMEVREGYGGDEPLALCPQTVIEDQFSVELAFNVDVVRLTARDVSGCAVDFAFVQGLVRYDDEGQKQFQTVEVRVFFRLVGTEDWVERTTINFTYNKQSIIRRTYQWDFPGRGQYEVRLVRLTPSQDENSDIRVLDRIDLSCLRSLRPESPFNFPGPLCVVALRVRASNQLNGVIDNYNADATLICKDWDAGTGTWIARATSNPASLFRHVLQGPANAYPKTDAQLDLDMLQEWHEFCDARGLKYDRVHDYGASRFEVLADIAAAGRATPHDDGVRWSVVIDRPQTTYVSAISPRNSWDFQGTTPQVVFPDAHRVQFIDASNGYQQAERIVPFPGVDPDTVSVTEDLTHPGKTDPDEIWLETRRRQYELIYRPHTYTASQDIESMVLSRGDLALLNHDVIDRDHVSARIKSISGQRLTIDTPVTMEAGRSYACSIRTASGPSIRRSVVASPGETSTLVLVGDIAAAAPGDLLLFGTSLRSPALDVVVKSIERGDNLTAKLTLVDAAPVIDELVAAEVPPPWNGRVGEAIDVSGLLPAVPRVTITDAALAFNVALAPGFGGIALPSTYVVSYRPHGSGPFSTVTVDAATAFASISGFAVGDVIDVKAKAVSLYGQPSADSALQQATLHAAIVNQPSLDADTVKIDSTGYTMDYF